MDTIELIERLASIPGPSGYEDAVALAIRDELAALPGEIAFDGIGNLVLTLPGPEDAPLLLLTAHMDEVGLLVKHVTPDGMVHCAPSGMIDERTLQGARVEIWTEDGPRLGVVGSKSRHQVTAADLTAAPAVEDLWIDIGAASAAEAHEAGVRVGRPATTWSPLTRLGPDKLVGKAIDNRAGCATLIEVARRVAERERDYRLAFAWVTQEEVGSRGARVLGQWLHPDVAVVVDTMPAGDPSTPLHKATAQVGEGPVIRAQDIRGTAGTVYSPAVRRRLEAAAEATGSPFQVDLYPTWTDACEVHLAGRGVATGGVFLPRRCSHSANEVIAVADVERAIGLLEHFTGAGATELVGLATRPALPLTGAGAR